MNLRGLYYEIGSGNHGMLHWEFNVKWVISTLALGTGATATLNPAAPARSNVILKFYTFQRYLVTSMRLPDYLGSYHGTRMNCI